VTDEAREAFTSALAASFVPQHLRGGLERYVVQRILPGGFLQAVLCNNLPQAMARHSGLSPEHAACTIGVIHGFLFEYAPPSSWGTREKVLAWTTTPDRLEIE
jgi:hypothetical protein